MMRGKSECLPSDAFPGQRVLLATRLSTRLRGMLFEPESDDVMVLLPCHDIHTFGMRYALDIAFLDRTGRVRRVARDVLPNKRLRDAGSAAVLERRARPREPWFEEGERLSLGCFARAALPDGASAHLKLQRGNPESPGSPGKAPSGSRPSITRPAGGRNHLSIEED